MKSILVLSMLLISLYCKASFTETCKVEVFTSDEKLVSSNYETIMFMSGWELNNIGTHIENFAVVDNMAVYAAITKEDGEIIYVLIQKLQIDTISLTKEQMAGKSILTGYNKYRTIFRITRSAQ